MYITDQLKENPIKTSISILTLVSMLIGTAFTLDSRYAKAEDIVNQKHYIEQNSLETKFAIDQLRRQSLEDKVFEIELIPEAKRSQSDRARLEKYKRDMLNIDTKWK